MVVASQTAYDNRRSTEVGICVTPKSAGSACTAGTGEKLLVHTFHRKRCLTNSSHMSPTTRIFPWVLDLLASWLAACSCCTLCNHNRHVCTSKTAASLLILSKPHCGYHLTFMWSSLPHSTAYHGACGVQYGHMFSSCFRQSSIASMHLNGGA